MDGQASKSGKMLRGHVVLVAEPSQVVVSAAASIEYKYLVRGKQVRALSLACLPECCCIFVLPVHTRRPPTRANSPGAGHWLRRQVDKATYWSYFSPNASTAYCLAKLHTGLWPTSIRTLSLAKLTVIQPEPGGRPSESASETETETENGKKTEAVKPIVPAHCAHLRTYLADSYYVRLASQMTSRQA